MLKGDLINAAYARARISGLTTQPTPEDMELALDKLEDMASMWEARNIRAGYFFEDTPDPNTPHNLPRAYWSAYKSNLALLLLTDFGKAPAATLVSEAQATLSFMHSATAQVKQVQHSPRAPRGSGSTLRYNRWKRFYEPSAEAPNEVTTVQMVTGDIRDFVEHFDSLLGLGETISSYVLTADTELTVLTESLTTPDVSYRIEATKAGVAQVKITATTSIGRVDTRVINFEVTDA